MKIVSLLLAAQLLLISARIFGVTVLHWSIVILPLEIAVSIPILCAVTYVASIMLRIIYELSIECIIKIKNRNE